MSLYVASDSVKFLWLVFDTEKTVPSIRRETSEIEKIVVADTRELNAHTFVARNRGTDDDQSRRVTSKGFIIENVYGRRAINENST